MTENTPEGQEQQTPAPTQEGTPGANIHVEDNRPLVMDPDRVQPQPAQQPQSDDGS
jgi:hypothetical protein